MNSNEGQCPVLGSAKEHGRKWLFLKVLCLSGSALTWYVSCMYFQLGQAVREMREVVWDTFHLGTSSLLRHPQAWVGNPAMRPCRHPQGQVGNPACVPADTHKAGWETLPVSLQTPTRPGGKPCMRPCRSRPHFLCSLLIASELD